MNAKSNGKQTLAFGVPSEGFDRMTEAVSQAAERGQAMVQAGLKNWEAETDRYFQEFSAHSRQTLDALGKCKGPMDVLSVEQQWLKARAQAYFESGMRFAKAFASVAQSIPGEIAAAKSAVEEAHPKA